MMTGESHEDSSWKSVIDAVKPAIVQLQVTAVRSFHDTIAGLRVGTGFVVDADRGLVLTNRHICTSGPQRVSAVFVGSPSMEELPLQVTYVDPGHDFALLRFDPKRLRQTPCAQVQLEPTGCRIKEEICMLGNGSNEKMQILHGTIARVDRNVPDVGHDSREDSNTFYAIAGTGTCSDAAGSPVVNRQGRAVGLFVAGRAETAHAFLLPLHRVARALKLIQAGTVVPRGTICTTFAYESFPECRRLGVEDAALQDSVLAGEQRADGTFSTSTPPAGMLVVRHIIPASMAATRLCPGDVLLEIEGKRCVDFVHLEDALDCRVGEGVRLVVCRGGDRIETVIEVQDLHSMIPQAFVELALGIFHQVPYSTAMRRYIPLQGIYVAQPGFVFGEAVPSDAIIKALNGFPCHDLASFLEQLEEIADNEFFSVTWMVPGNAPNRRVQEDYVKMQRQWSLYTAWSLHPETRQWVPRRLRSSRRRAGTADSDESTTASPFDEVTGDEATSEVSASCDDVHMSPAECSESADSGRPTKKARMSKLCGAIGALDRSTCSVVFKVAHHLDLDVFPGGGNVEQDIVCLHGMGVVIDAARGLVLTDRGTVPQRLADIEVTLNGDTHGASVWHMHPEHSMVVLKLEDPCEVVHEAFGRAAVFEQHEFQPGEHVEFVGVDSSGARFSTQVQVQSQRFGKFPRHWPPRWREKNLEAVVLIDDPPNCTSGVLCDSKGAIYALYAVVQGQDGEAQFACGYGIPSDIIQPVLEQIAQAEKPIESLAVPSLQVEFQKVSLSKLQRLPPKLRPSGKWIQKLRAAGEGALQVSNVTRAGPCNNLLQIGDLLVAVDEESVCTVHSLEALLHKAILDRGSKCSDPLFKICLTLLRQGAEHKVEVLMPLLTSDGSTRVLLWHGLLLQETPRAVQESRTASQGPPGVHISHTWLGSPADSSNINGELLVAVDGEPTPTLDAVIKLTDSTSRSCGRRHIRVESADMTGRQFVSMLEPDPLFWPTAEIAQDQQGSWSCIECS